MRKKEKQRKTLKLQNAAIRAYLCVHGEPWEDVKSESELPLGDSFMLAIWREVGEASGDPQEAYRMMQVIKEEIMAVEDAMWDAKRWKEYSKRGA